MKIPEGILEKL